MSIRILYFAPFYSIHTRKWVNHFALDPNYSVTLIDFIETDNKEFKSSFKFDDNVCINTFPLHKNKFFDLIFRFFIIIKYIKKVKPDIIHVHFIHLNAFIVSFFSKKLVLTAWGSDAHTLPNKSIFNKFIFRRAILNADLITTQSQYIKNILLSHGVNKNKITLISNGVDIKIFNSGKTNNHDSRFSNAYPIIFSPRLLRKFYNIDIIIKSIIYLKINYPKCLLIISKIGIDYIYYDELNEIIRIYDLHSNILFLEELNQIEMSQIYKQSNFIISLANDDSSCLSIIESLFCGTIPIINKLDAYTEYLFDCKNCIYVNKDPKDISTKITNVLESSKLQQSIINNNYKFIDIHNIVHTMNNMSELYKNLYNIEI